METSEAYRVVRGRMIDLAQGADPGTPVPSCPGWTIKDLLAHTAGVAGDVLAGNIAEAGTEPWVAAQLAARSGQSLEEIVAEWEVTGPQVDEVCAALGDAVAQLIFDVATHEQDLRGALGRPAEADGALDVALRWAAGTWGSQEAPTAGSLRIDAGEVVATRGDGDPVVSVSLDPSEAILALTGRRTAAEVRAYPWSGDVTPWLPAFTWGPFVLADG